MPVLPSRIRWTATTSLPSGEVRAVSFIVDHQRWWIDPSPPYSYGPPGAYLATRWILPAWKQPAGLHTFTVKVIGTNGERWKKTVRARTPGAGLAPHGPGRLGRYLGLYGWGRLSAADLADPPTGDLFASYTGRLVFIGASLFSGDYEHEFAWEFSSDSKRLYIGTPIYLLAVGGPASSYGYRKLEEVLCTPDGPPATYAWSLTRGRRYYGSYYTHYLHLRAVSEPCDKRREMLEGVWEDIQD